MVVLAEGIVEHGPAFAAWYRDIGHEPGEDLLKRFADTYAGRYESWSELAREELEAAGVDDPLEQMPEHLRPYLSFDYEG